MSATQGWPQRIGAYEVVSHLGRGRTSDVFEVRAADGERLALKWLHSSLDPRRVERELHVARRVRHPRLASFRDAGLYEERTYLTMQLVEGTKLRDAATTIRNGPGGTARYSAIAALMADVADGLAALHEAGLVHRDLRPETIVVDREGRATIIDVGVAKPLDALLDPDHEGLSLTQDVGSEARMRLLSPEQIRGEEATPRTDLYALGVLFYEALTGAFPCDGLGPIAIASAHMHEVPQPAHGRDGRVPEVMSVLASELLAKDSRDRPAFAIEVARRLRGETEPTRVATRSRLASPALEERSVALERARRALNEVSSGEGSRVVLVDGMMGSGKTRLVTEIVRRARGRGFITAAVGARNAELVDALIRDLSASIEETLGREALEQAFAGAAAAARERVIDDDEHVPSTLDPISAGSPQHRLEIALRVLLRQASALAPVLIAIDDAHLADDDVCRTLSVFADIDQKSRLGLVVTLSDAEYPQAVARLVARVGARRTTVRIETSPLSRTAVAAAVGSMLGVRVPPKELITHLERAGGNPFVLRELVQAAADASALRREEDGWVFDARLAADLPATVQAVIEGRLRALSDNERVLTIEAAILGSVIRHDVLQLTTSLGDQLLDTLDHLLRKRVLEDIPAPRPSYAFTHASLRDVILRDLSPVRLAALHRRVAESLVAATRDRPSYEALQLIAHHWEGAGNNKASASAWLWLIDRAVRRGDAVTAERAVEAVERTGDAEMRASDLFGSLRVDVARLRGDFATAERLLRAAAADPIRERSADAYVRLANILRDEGRMRDALDAAVAGIRAIGAASLPSGAMAYLVILVGLLQALFRSAPKLVHQSAGGHQSGDHGQRDLAIEAYLVATRAAYVLDRRQSYAAFFLARARARVLRSRDYWIYTECALTLAIAGLGLRRRAMPLIRECRKTYLAISDPRLQVQAAIPLVVAHALFGAEVAAGTFLEDLLRRVQTVGDREGESITLGYLAYVRWQRGDIAGARQIADRHLGDRSADLDVPSVGQLQIILAACAVASGEQADVAREARNAERLASGRAAVAPHDELLCSVAATMLALAMDDPGSAAMWGRRAAVGIRAANVTTAMSIETWPLYLTARALDGIRLIEPLDRAAVAACHAALGKFDTARAALSRGLAMFALATDGPDEALRILDDEAATRANAWGVYDAAVNDLVAAAIDSREESATHRRERGEATLAALGARAPKWLSRLPLKQRTTVALPRRA